MLTVPMLLDNPPCNFFYSTNIMFLLTVPMLLDNPPCNFFYSTNMMFLFENTVV